MSNCKLYKGIPNKLKEYRLAKGLTQQQVAQLLQLKNNTLISRWENGKTFPDLINTIKLCGLYGITLNDLFGNLITIIQQNNNKGTTQPREEISNINFSL